MTLFIPHITLDSLALRFGQYRTTLTLGWFPWQLCIL